MKGRIVSAWLMSLLLASALACRLESAERLLYLRQKDRSLWVENLDGSGRTLVATEIGDGRWDCISIAPDGKAAVVWHPQGDVGLYLVSLTGKADVRFIKSADGLLGGRTNGASYTHFQWGDEPGQFYVRRELTGEDGTLRDGGLLILDLGSMKVHVFLHGDPYRSPIERIFYSPDSRNLTVQGTDWVDVLDARAHKRLFYLADSRDDVDAVWLDNQSIIVRFVTRPMGRRLPKKPIIVDVRTGSKKKWPYPKFELRRAVFCAVDYQKRILWAVSQPDRVVQRRELDLKTGAIRTTTHEPMWFPYSRLTESGYVVRHERFTDKCLWVVSKPTGSKRLVAEDVVDYELLGDTPAVPPD